MLSYYHVSFTIGGRTISDRVHGSIMAAYARLDLLTEQHEEIETMKRGRWLPPVLATNCKVRLVEVESDPLVRAITHEITVRNRIRQWGI